jgi:hypothetical protein
LLLCLALCVAPLVGAAENPVTDPATERIAAGFLGIQSHVANMKMKLREGIAGVGTGALPTRPNPDREVWVDTCCGFNLDKIGFWLAQIAAVVEQLDRYHANTRNTAALGEITTMRTNLTEVAVGMSQFAKSKSQFDADYALKGIIRPFNAAREASQRLAECCPVPDGVVQLPSLEPRAPSDGGQ